MKAIWVLDPRKEFKQQVYQFPTDYVTLTEARKVTRQLETKQARVDDMLDLIRVLKAETTPIQDTTDPKAVEECWLELEQKIKEIK